MKDCSEIQRLIMGYLDDELDDESRSLVTEHLAGCAVCREEERSFRRLAEMTESIEFIEPTEKEWRAHWDSIYNRLERGFGWVLASIGAIVLLLYGVWRLVADFLMDPEVSPILRVGVATITAGAVVLGVSVVRERIRTYRVDRYEEVEL